MSGEWKRFVIFSSNHTNYVLLYAGICKFHAVIYILSNIQECVRDRDGYYDQLPQSIEHPKLKDKLEKGEASSIVMVSLYPKMQHKYRLGTDVLMDTFSTYYMRRRHPIKKLVDMQMGILTDAGITLHIKNRFNSCSNALQKLFSYKHNI